MSATRNPAQEQFELNKDNPKVQALLNVLSIQREHVVEWEMTNYLSGTEETVTYRVVFSDESEWRGEIMWVWQNREWIASCTRIPAEVAAQIRQAAHLQEKMIGNDRITIEQIEKMFSGSNYFREMHGEWLVEEKKPLDVVIEEYYARCDAYDNSNPEAIYTTNRNAYIVRRRLCQQHNLTDREFHDALQDYQRRKR